MANPSLGIMGQIRPELNRLPSKDLQDRDLELPKNVLKRIKGDILLSLLKSLQGAATQTGLPCEVAKRHVPPALSEEAPELLTQRLLHASWSALSCPICGISVLIIPIQ